MKATTGIEDVFAAYGDVAYHVQLMEYDLVTIWMLDSVTQGVSLTKRDLLRFQEDWGKRTFGQLLKALQKSDLISAEIKDFLEQLRVTRNRLMHGFFLDGATDLQTNDGRENVEAELQRMKALLEKGQQLFEDVLDTYLKDFGIDADTIRREVLEKHEDAEPPAGGDALARAPHL
ncbi:hypothetical protein KAX17_10470 [Candidatus Bipolaricaulota bacterium]|nr:hypothetical protein [Candidatus Bipolaricaulota bacterium]